MKNYTWIKKKEGGAEVFYTIAGSDLLVRVSDNGKPNERYCETVRPSQYLFPEAYDVDEDERIAKIWWVIESSYRTQGNLKRLSQPASPAAIIRNKIRSNKDAKFNRVGNFEFYNIGDVQFMQKFIDFATANGFDNARINTTYDGGIVDFD